MSGADCGSTAIVPVHSRNGAAAELDLSAKASAISLLSDVPTLTPDLWANVYGYTRYEDCLRAFTVCKSFLAEVIPRIKEIAVFDPRALKVGPARRFTGVKSVVIACIFADPPDAPPLPERPEGIGFDIAFHYELVIMVDSEPEPSRPLGVDPLVVSASVPFLSALPCLRQVDFLRYVVEIHDISDYEVAIRDDKPLRTYAIRYYDGYDSVVWSKRNDLNMRSLMMSLGGGYASGLLSNNVIVTFHSLFGYSTIGDDPFSSGCFSSYCASWEASNKPGEKRECMCHFISKNFPIQMVASNFCYGKSGCLPMTECMEIVLERKGGRELLLSPDYILSQCEWPYCRGMEDMASCYSQFGLRPEITMLDIKRYFPEGPDPSWWKNKFQKPVRDDDVSDTNDDDQSSHSDQTCDSPTSVGENDWDEEVYEPYYLGRRRLLLKGLANFWGALESASSSIDASV